MSDPIVILGAARTPMGAFQGDFSTLAAHDLGGAAIKETSMLGSCHTYSDGVVEHAYRHNHTVRDFTHDDTALLRFL